MTQRYRLFGTTADVGVVSYGRDMKEAFENQAAGMFSIMADLRGVGTQESFEVEAGAAGGVDDEALLAAWLEELLFIFDVRGVFLKEFEIYSMQGGMLRAAARGEKIDADRHVIKTPVKAVTYHKLEVKKTKDGVRTRVVYDI